MRVLMLRNAKAELGCNLLEGEAGEVPDQLGVDLVNMRIAVELPKEQPIEVPSEEPAKKEIQGVAKTPKISKAEKQTLPPKGDEIE